MSDEAAALGFLRSLRIAASVITLAIIIGLSLPVLLSHLDDYPYAIVQISGYLLLALIITLDTVLIYQNRSWGAFRWSVALLLLVISVATRLDLPPAQPMPVGDWAFGQIGWLGVLVLFDQPLTVLVAFIALHVLASGIILIIVDHAGGFVLACFGLLTVATCSFELAVGAATVALRRIATSAITATHQQQDLLIREEVAVRLHADRQQRYAELAKTARPLIVGLADGTLDPANPGTKARCTIEAARMRRLFAEADDTEDPLLHELRACVGLAERRGVMVALAAIGRWPPLARELRRALTDAPLSVLATAATQARVTVVGTPAAVTVSVVADATLAEVPEPAMDGVQVTSAGEGSHIWVEARWVLRMS